MLRALESCLVDSVCDVGVDINMAVSHDHLAGPLAFVGVYLYCKLCSHSYVGGLGLRKADALRHNIKVRRILSHLDCSLDYIGMCFQSQRASREEINGQNCLQ